MKIAIVLLAFWSLCRAQVSPSADKANIEGSVTNPAGQPVPKANVRLIEFGGPAQVTYTVETDSQGHFTIGDIAPGHYSLSAERVGYIGIGSKALTLDSGQSMTGVSVKLTPQGILAGSVIDQDGEPLPNANVVIYHKVSLSSLERRLVTYTAGNASTNADGVFAIGNLLPGKYYISARPASNRLLDQAKKSEAYMPTFYPDVIDASKAIPIQISAGEQRRGLEIRIRKVPVYRVRGRVINIVTGEPATPPGINLVPKDPLALLSAPPQTAVHDGAFEFTNVLPGDYVLQATPDGMSSERILVGRQNITVTRGDVDNVLLQIRPSAEMPGRITVEGTPSAPLANLSVNLSITEGANYSLAKAEIKPDGSFLVRSLEAAPYGINVGGLAPNTYVKSIRFAGQDVTNTPLDLSSGATGIIEIVLSANAAVIGGVVHDANGVAIEDGRVVLWGPPGSEIKLASAGPGGRFILTSLAPGDYRVASFQRQDLLSSGEAGIFELIESAKGQATPLTLNENSQAIIEPPLIAVAEKPLN